MPFCPDCGKEVGEGLRFCPDCGKTLKKESNSMVVWGYVCALLALFIFPLGFGIAGVVIGITNPTKGRVGHGIAQIVIAVTFGILGFTWGVIVWGG